MTLNSHFENPDEDKNRKKKNLDSLLNYNAEDLKMINEFKNRYLQEYGKEESWEKHKIFICPMPIEEMLEFWSNYIEQGIIAVEHNPIHILGGDLDGLSFVKLKACSDISLDVKGFLDFLPEEVMEDEDSPFFVNIKRGDDFYLASRS